MILLDVDDKLTEQRLRNNLTSDEAVAKIEDEKLESTIISAVQEYHTHMEGVKDVYKGMISVIDGNKHKDLVVQEIARILKLKKINAPRRAPKIILIGPPGSGKTTQAIKLSEKLKVIHIQVASLLKNKITENTEEGKEIWTCMKEGIPIDDEILQKIIEDRLSQKDVKMNGFVLDGFPLNSKQTGFLIEKCNIKPSHLIYLELNDHKCYERLEYRLFDPVSGIYYDVFHNPPKDEKVIKRLIHSPEDEHHVVKKCLMRHKEFFPKKFSEFVVDLQKKQDVGDLININADNDPEQVFRDICSEIGI